MKVKDLPIRKRNRLHGYDYSKNGDYFVTICAKDRHELFSQIVVGDGLARPALTGIGNEIVNMIDYINNRYNECKIVQFVIMPNHVHLIIRIVGEHHLWSEVRSFPGSRFFSMATFVP